MFNNYVYKGARRERYVFLKITEEYIFLSDGRTCRRRGFSDTDLTGINVELICNDTRLPLITCVIWVHVSPAPHVAGREETKSSLAGAVTGGGGGAPVPSTIFTYEIWTALLFIDDKRCPSRRPAQRPCRMILRLAVAIRHRSARRTGRGSHMPPRRFSSFYETNKQQYTTECQTISVKGTIKYLWGRYGRQFVCLSRGGTVHVHFYIALRFHYDTICLYSWDSIKSNVWQEDKMVNWKIRLLPT